jgi:hypothetical protein
LAHFGRKSGKRFETRVWFIEDEGTIWVGSQDMERNWVRNVEAMGRAELDFGDGPSEYHAARSMDVGELESFRAAILAKHPISARIILFFARGKTEGCFRLQPASTPSSP